VLTSLELDLGQLIKDPSFTLFEAVGALEVSGHKTWLLVPSKYFRSWIARWIVDTWNLERPWKTIMILVSLYFLKRLSVSLTSFSVTR
jgi:hypothetical protein